MLDSNITILCKKSSEKFEFFKKTIPFDPAGGVFKEISPTEFRRPGRSFSQMKNQFAEAWCLD